jgi:hypothetical protein
LKGDSERKATAVPAQGTRRGRHALESATVTATRTLGHDDVLALRQAAARFGEENGGARKAAAIARAATCDIVDAGVLVAWHDCLLYQIAYPEAAAQLRAARIELRRVAALARRITLRSAQERRRLTGSGIAWTESTFAFGWDVARWLVARFPRHCELDSFGDDGVPLPEVLAASLPPLEFALLGGEDDASEWLDTVRGRASRLAWLVAQFERLPCTDSVRAPLFDALRVYVALRPGASRLSRTFVRGLPAPVHVHRDGLARAIDLRSLVERPLPPARPLTGATRARAIDAACAMLASLGRETDAIALTYPAGVEWHDLGRGLAVALYAMRPDRRDPLDSHVGMMVFKNGVAIAYGGGWPLAGTCRIGINVFEPYRGGESALVFAQVLRVYRQRFRVERFLVEPTQFGGTNVDGLRSGAFWFYLRLGFRPVDPGAAARACDELARMREDPRYRTPIARLRRMTESDLELVLGGSGPSPDSAALSRAVTNWIDSRHAGDRTAAEAAAVRLVVAALGAGDPGSWRESERRALVALAPLLAQIADLRRWPAAERRRLCALVRAKGGDEFRFQRLLATHRRLRGALAAIAAQHG